MYKRILAIFCVAMALCLGVSALEAPVLDAKAALLYEATSGEFLVAQNIDEPLYPASTTKMLTALVAVEHCAPDEVITVHRSAVENLYAQGSSSRLEAGDTMEFYGMLQYLLIASGNDAANAIAEHISGSLEGFAELMNQKAAQLGCENSHFVNPTGLHDENHYTTARDLLKIAMACMENDTIADIVGTAKVRAVFHRDGVPYGMTLHNTNCLISVNSDKRYLYDGVFGIKTGTTTPAGMCLVAGARSGNLRFFTVLLGGKKGPAPEKELGQYTETIKMLDYGMQHFSMQEMVDTNQPVVEVPVELAKDRDTLVLMPGSNITALLPDDFTLEQVEQKHTVNEDIVAPIAKGDVLGQVEYVYNGRSYGVVPLVASISIERSQTLYILDQVKTFLSSTGFKIGAAVFVLLVVLLVIFLVIRNRRNRSRRYGSVRRRRR